MKILVSACLLGENCKYNGGNNLSPDVQKFVSGKEVIPVCPEMQAGYGCPRIPIEIVDGVLMTRDGKNMDDAMQKAIASILDFLKIEDIHCAVLKARSPTCGVHQIYDGTFSGTLIPGMGLFAKALKDAGYTVFDDEEI